MTEQVEAYVNGQRIEAEIIDVDTSSEAETKQSKKKKILKGGQLYNFDSKSFPAKLLSKLPALYKNNGNENTFSKFLIGLGIGAGAYLAISKLRKKPRRRRNRRRRRR